MKIKPALSLRLGLVVCAIPIGALVAVGRGEKIAAVAAAVLLLAALLVAFVGQLTAS